MTMPRESLKEMNIAQHTVNNLHARADKLNTDLKAIYSGGNMVTFDSLMNDLGLNDLAELADGVSTRKIAQTESSCSFMVRFAPYAILGAHMHDVPEKINIHCGTLSDGADNLEDGHIIKPHELHAISAGPVGATCTVSFWK